jgi:ferric-dicitrate binding protein FerR (iron transport regulator)
MTEQRDIDAADGPEERIDRDLNQALRTAPLSPEALARIHSAVQKEWRDLHPATRPRRKLWAAAAVAAGVCSIALVLAWVRQSPPTPLLFGSIARIEQGLVSLPDGSNLRVAAGTLTTVLGSHDLELLRGMIYVDHPPAAGASSPLRVHTRAGIIEHVGTAYEVLSNEQMVRVRVREGQIRLRNAGVDTVAQAGTEIVANSDGVVSRGSVALSGEPWRWASSLAPAYEIEGRPLLEFLEFESRELGYELVFSDPHAKQVAERTILHGTVRGREPLDAVNSVLATTSLSYSVRGNTLQVHSTDGT